MKTTAWIGAAAGKELRALLPMSVATAVALTAVALLARVVPGGLPEEMGLVAFAVGLASTGAWSVGHEYAYRTLGFHLSQPIDRWRLLAVKLATLAGATALACAIGWITFAIAWPDAVDTRALTLTLGALAAVGTAPALTMICRSPLAGAVFTLAIPAVSWVAADVVGALSDSPRDSESRRQLQLAWLTYSTVAAAAAGAAAVWFLNGSLEATEQRETSAGRGDLTPEQLLTPSNPTRHQRAGWLLLKKELHLQQMPLLIGGLFVLVWLVLTLAERFTDGAAMAALPVITAIQFMVIPLLVGALASAEERQLGTLEWQRLLPMPGWQQWTLKVATVLLLSTVLAVGIPVVLAAIHPSSDHLVFSARKVMVVIALAVTSLYVSSLAPRGMWALLVSIPVALGVLALIGLVLSTQVWQTVAIAEVSLALKLRKWSSDAGFFWATLWVVRLTVVAATMAVMFLVLRFAASNHRSALPSRLQFIRQAGWIAVMLFLWLLTIVAATSFDSLAFRTVVDASSVTMRTR